MYHHSKGTAFKKKDEQIILMLILKLSKNATELKGMLFLEAGGNKVGYCAVSCPPKGNVTQIWQ